MRLRVIKRSSPRSTSRSDRTPATSGTLLLDDKGLVFTLCFGMPHDAHADDALRAVRAGLAIHSELSRLAWTAPSALHLAKACACCLAGPNGGFSGRSGRFMHVAGRLMEAAGSGMLCTEEVADRVRRVVSSVARAAPVAERRALADSRVSHARSEFL